MIVVHAPAARLKDILNRKGYRTLCGRFAYPPPAASVKRDDRGEYLVVGPHEDYYGWCGDCANLDGDLYPVA